MIAMTTISTWYGFSTEVTPTADEYALPIIVNYGRDGVTHEDAIIAASRGVALLFDDANSAPGGPWRHVLEAWSCGRIRKVVRKAKNSAWDRVHSMEGVLSVQNSTWVQILLPHPISEAAPRDVSRLQMKLELPSAPLNQDIVDGSLGIALNPEVVMSTGKSIAQAAHIAHLAVMGKQSVDSLGNWSDSGLGVHLVDWNQVSPHDVEVRDAGLTEIAPDTLTARGRFF